MNGKYYCDRHKTNFYPEVSCPHCKHEDRMKTQPMDNMPMSTTPAREKTLAARLLAGNLTREQGDVLWNAMADDAIRDAWRVIERDWSRTMESTQKSHTT